MSSADPPSFRKRKQRVDVACDFCRQRKLGCDNAKPKCENCLSYRKDCSYSGTSRKQRSSASRIGAHVEISPVEQDAEVSDTLTRTIVSTRPQLLRFHGPTSSMFDGGSLLRRGDVNDSAVQKSHLLAETARQRQLEPINLRLRKLDFDGLNPDQTVLLFSLFWNRQHATGSIVYRPCFMRDMASDGPYFSHLLLNSILFIASKYSTVASSPCDAADLDAAPGMGFRRRAESILFDPVTKVLTKSSITTIQALLLMSDALFSWCDETSLSWHYLGIAINMIIDLGIHAENSISKTPEDLEVARRVFWAAFVLDKQQSIYQGRTPRLRNQDCRVPVEFLDEFEELEPFHPLGYSGPGTLDLPTYSVSTFEQLCTLSTITDRILSSFYVENSSESEPEELHRTTQTLHADLIRWQESLPAHLSINFDDSGNPNTSNGTVALPHTLCLMLMFHTLLILLHRPFVFEGHLKSTAAHARNEFTICESAASDIDVLLHWYRKHWCMKAPPYFVSYATYVSATIHVRVAAQNPHGEAHQRLQICLEILSEHQKVCHAPRRALANLLLVVQRLNVNVGSIPVLMSRTANCDTPIVDGHNSEPAMLASNEVRTFPNQQDPVGNLMSPTRIAAEYSLQAEPDAPVLVPDPLGEFDLDVGVLPEWMSFFDLDPIFGFEDFPNQYGPDP
ncbi:fungal-specific transcription factor domain-containing protein [Massariosphaeria phaeospora]|uniref:Fungal-specific transcription factor domain-containing protein n=1 Tax=Massariosphaeria phaeospora TaxID=100035 RepID=A0A7C8I543_9PLEO|nr:fungal-specific transcription factor domain-containing protein [Massariosphaeria phaeospora]